MIWLELKVFTEAAHISFECHPISQVLTQCDHHNIHRPFVLLEHIFNCALLLCVPEVFQSESHWLLTQGIHFDITPWLATEVPVSLQHLVQSDWCAGNYLLVKIDMHLSKWLCFFLVPFHVARELASICMLISCPSAPQSSQAKKKKNLLASVHGLSFHASSVKSLWFSDPFLMWHSLMILDSNRNHPHTGRFPTSFQHRENTFCCVITYRASGIILPLFHLRSLHSLQMSSPSMQAPIC